MADIYQTSDYTDWWTKMYGNTANNGTILSAPVKTFTGSDGKEETLSDADYRIGQQLYNSYKQEMQYQKDHDAAAAASKTAMENAKIEADITRQRMEKYLPQQLALQGLYGTGVSEDAYLKLQNQYHKAVSDANATHNANLNAYKSALDSQKHALWQQTTDGVNSIVDNENANSAAKYEEAYAMLDPSMLTSDADVDTVLAQYKDQMSDVHYSALERYAQTVKEDIAEIQKEKEKTTDIRVGVDGGPTHFLGNGRDLNVKIGDRPYTVEADVELNENDAAHVYAVTENNVKHKEFFKYDGEIYVRFNDTVHKILSVDDDTNSADYRALMEYLTTGEVINSEKSTVSALDPNYLEQQRKKIKTQA